MGTPSVSGSHHCWIRISWLCWNTEVIPRGKPVLCRAWLHKTLRARVSREALNSLPCSGCATAPPPAKSFSTEIEEGLSPDKQHFSFHPLQLNTCSAWLGIPSRSWSFKASPLLSWIVFIHQHHKGIAVVLIVHLCFRAKSIFFLHVIIQECTASGSDKY